MSPITEKNVENVVLGSRPQGRLIHGSGEQLRVPDDDVGVVDAKLLVARVRLALRYQVGFDSRSLVWTEHQTKDL